MDWKGSVKDKEVESSDHYCLTAHGIHNSDQSRVLCNLTTKSANP